MSDDTTRTDDWGSTEASGNSPQSEAQSAPQGTAERVGFCQDCGKPLTQTTVRNVGTGVFCEPCLTVRVGATNPASGYTTVPPYSAVPPQAAVASEPSPALATILGFIPGVGAMYNGQFAKGVTHLIIFALLVSIADNFSWVFWWFVWGWIFYMVFEAYHTAVARRDGLPLPNAFGFNDIGERMGFGKSWGAVNTVGNPVQPSGTGTPQPSSATPVAAPVPAYAYVPVNPVPVGTAPDWVGYVPPTAFAGPPPVPPAAAQTTSPWGHAPYTKTYTGAPQAAYGAAGPPIADLTPDMVTRRFPTGALWLIGLGVLILIANLLPDWKLTERWWPPVLFAGLSVWTLTRRMRSNARLVCIVRWPVILMVLAVMLALHAAYIPVTTGLTCSVLLIAFGALLLLERTAGASPADAPPVPVYASPAATAAYPVAPTAAGVQAEEARARAAWVATEGDPARNDPDSTKGGQ
jgi:hypothetical protein